MDRIDMGNDVSALQWTLTSTLGRGRCRTDQDVSLRGVFTHLSNETPGAIAGS